MDGAEPRKMRLAVLFGVALCVGIFAAQAVAVPLQSEHSSVVWVKLLVKQGTRAIPSVATARRLLSMAFGSWAAVKLPVAMVDMPKRVPLSGS